MVVEQSEPSGDDTSAVDDYTTDIIDETPVGDEVTQVDEQNDDADDQVSDEQ